MARIVSLLVVVACAALHVGGAFDAAPGECRAQSPSPPETPPNPAPPNPAPKDGDPPSRPERSPDQEAIEKLFNARMVDFGADGQITLMYFFSKTQDAVLKDFMPDIATTEKRIRWSQGSDQMSGLVIAEQGVFLHRALWKRVRLKATMVSRSSSRERDFLAAVYTSDKGKLCIGSNLGKQLVTLKNGRLSGTPQPAKLSATAFQQSLDFGLTFKDGVFTCLDNDVKSVDSAATPDLVKRLGPGQVGLMWSGSIKCFITGLIIEGELDPEWLKKELAGKGG